MQSFGEFLEEARRNKDHPAQRRLDAFDVLGKYAGRSDISITYTSVDKVGVNPKSKYPSTPSGVYSFPLDAVWNDIYKGGLQQVPFEIARAKYVFVLKETLPIKDVSDYTQADFTRDIEYLRKTYGKEFVDGLIYWYTHGAFPDDIDVSLYHDRWYKIHTDDSNSWAKGKITAYQKYKNRYPFIAMGMITDEILQIQMWSRKIKKVPPMKSAIYRGMGYNGFSDKTGLGLIHQAENHQIVFLTPKAYSVVDRIVIDKKTDFLSLSDREKVSMMRNQDDQSLSDEEKRKLAKRYPVKVAWDDTSPLGWDD